MTTRRMLALILLILRASNVAFTKRVTLGRWNSDWQLEFLGRSDRQTKIRGFRIELGEVEFQLRAIDAISDAYVIAEMVADKRELIAYLVPGQRRDLSHFDT